MQGHFIGWIWGLVFHGMMVLLVRGSWDFRCELMWLGGLEVEICGGFG